MQLVEQENIKDVSCFIYTLAKLRDYSRSLFYALSEPKLIAGFSQSGSLVHTGCVQ